VLMRNKQYLAAIRPLDGALAMSTLQFADEIIPQSEIDAIPRRPVKPDPSQLKLAVLIIDSLAAEWDPTRFHDTYIERLRDLIQRKSRGEAILVDEPLAFVVAEPRCWPTPFNSWLVG
jgi:DNA end-binding protein Ku